MKLILLVAVVLLLFSAAYAEGPVFCDVKGHVTFSDGSMAPNGIPVKVTIQDTLDKASNEYVTQIVYTKTDPFAQSGYFYVSYTQGDNCNYGEPVTVAVAYDGQTGKTTSVLTELMQKGQYDVVLGKETSTSSSSGSSPPATTSNAVVSDNLMCEIHGFVRDSRTLLGENSIPVTVILQDTKGKATGESIPIQTETKNNPAIGDGYFYVAFGSNADCNVGEPVKIIAQKDTQFGETDSFVTYSPSKDQYDVLLKPLSENVTNTVRNNPSTIIFTTVGMILLILALVYLKRRNKLGHY